MKIYQPQLGSRIIHKKKRIDITEFNQHLYPQAKDPEFRRFRIKHKVSTYLVLGLCVCHFEVFKIFYSHFFSFDMFKAKFTNAQILRASYTKI
jgi:hypothetical protein